MTTLAPPTPDAPDATPLRARLLAAAGLGWLAVNGLAWSMFARWGTSAAQPLVAVAVFTAMMAIAVTTIRGHHPFASLGPANHVTVMRAMLVALAASALAEPAHRWIAWALVTATVVIVLLDGLDGWLARRTRMTSTFGARFDMEIDAFFVLVLSLLVWRHDKAGAWVIASGLMRYAFVAAGWMWPWLAQPLRSTPRGKTVAIMQLTALGLALVPTVPPSISEVICAVALLVLAWSFAVDVRFLQRSHHPQEQ